MTAAGQESIEGGSIWDALFRFFAVSIMDDQFYLTCFGDNADIQEWFSDGNGFTWIAKKTSAYLEVGEFLTNLKMGTRSLQLRNAIAGKGGNILMRFA